MAEQNSNNQSQNNNTSNNQKENQQTSFNENQYGNNPDNMANYSGNFGTGTYDTDYGEGTFPDTNAQRQGDNWINRTLQENKQNTENKRSDKERNS